MIKLTLTIEQLPSGRLAGRAQKVEDKSTAAEVSLAIYVNKAIIKAIQQFCTEDGDVYIAPKDTCPPEYNPFTSKSKTDADAGSSAQGTGEALN